AMILLTSGAHAHGGVGRQDNRCVLRIGLDLMVFTAYQPQNTQEPFCDDKLRDLLMEIRIIKDLGTHIRMNGLPVLTDAELVSREILDPVTILYVPPKKYPTGTLTFQYTFPE